MMERCYIKSQAKSRKVGEKKYKTAAISEPAEEDDVGAGAGGLCFFFLMRQDFSGPWQQIRTGTGAGRGRMAQNNMPSGPASAGFQLRSLFACRDSSSGIKGDVYVCAT